MTTRYFSPALFKFLRDLEANNERDWFNANKDRFEEHIKDPALEFINGFAPRLYKISPYFSADSRPVGGSLFRIYRDTRFSKDKTPYKTNTGMHFRHQSAKDVHSPGYYLHFQPGENFAGLGIWRPDTATAGKIRTYIAEEPTKWKRATQGKRVTDALTLEGDSLKRPPKGFDPDHPLIEDLKRKDFIASTRISQKVVTSADFMDEWEKICKAGSPFMRFLCEAVGVPF